MLRFKENVPIGSIAGSVYNPRKIEDEAIKRLQDSIKKFGMIKPLIVNETDNTIVAGHQRKKAADSIGLEMLPCIFINATNKQDEILFNLFHNSIETSACEAFAKTFAVGRYVYCENADIEVGEVNGELPAMQETNRLLSRYGEWGSVVVDEGGRVLMNTEYAYCCKMAGYGVLTYCVSDDEVESFIEYLSADYGKYHYAHMGIKTYHQFLAQPRRLSTESNVSHASVLYEKHIIPRIDKSTRIVDIGAGRMKYVDLLASKGYKIFGYEPSLTKKGSFSIDIPRIAACIKKIEAQVRKEGLFDICVLEAVINSVADNDFEKAVLVTCNSLLHADGVLVTCTRNMDEITQKQKTKKLLGSMTTKLSFLDDDNYTLSVQGNIAYLQKYHTVESYVDLLEKYFDKVEMVKRTSGYIYCYASQPKPIDLEEREHYLNKEWNIEYPGSYHHNAHTGLVAQLMEKVGERDGDKGHLSAMG